MKNAKHLMERLLSAVYNRQPHVKVVVAVTGGGVSAARFLFCPGSSSTLLHFTVPYSRASLESFLGSGPPSTTLVKLGKCCTAETAERMAWAAWTQAMELSRQEADATDASNAVQVSSAFERYRAAIGIACTAGLATTYPKKGPHECFLSVCKAARFSGASPTRTWWRPHCETVHIEFDKTVGRSRSEEDKRVSQWLVYLLSKAADVDKDAVHAFHTALEAASTGTDRIVHVTRGAEPEDPLDELCNNTADPLTSVAFLPEMPRTGVPTRVAARNFDFRGLILPGSFNPVHNGHITLARTAQQLVHARTGLDLPVAFELAVSNADKGAIDRSTIVARIAACETAFNGDAWPVFVTQAPLFRDKARVFPGCTFVVGADTVRRLVDPTYYQGNEHEMVLQLDAIARQGCSFVVAGRVETTTHRFVSAHEVVETYVPSLFRRLFVPIPQSTFRMDISSTAIRRDVVCGHVDI